MSEQLDYVNFRIEKAREDKITRYLAGNLKTIEEIQFDRGYLKALQDIEVFQRDYISLKNPPKNEDD
ncbi:MAG: hypothetical protein KGL39_53270 [Patescibacteria group bacterium]|nr:hypothetical protein [Patescibacteria group bacterium]